MDTLKRIDLQINDSDEYYTLNPPKIICLGMNYAEHIKEFNRSAIPTEPVLFPKFANALIPNGAPILIPKFVQDTIPDYRIDYEVELALIISKKGKFIPESEALDYVLGYTILNDISQREIQKKDVSGWYRAKSFDTFAPIGPRLVSPDKIGDPNNLNLKLYLNGEKRQDSNTKHMIFSVPQIISYISKNFTLQPGDIISTGTPQGVGKVKPGDMIRCEIEKIGILENPVQNE
jgi:2-keto-4-pentenoate hydratase/2-oxohepta-3-ene-1,7-dioic acid hydratase in catechol pathway